MIAHVPRPKAEAATEAERLLAELVLVSEAAHAAARDGDLAALSDALEQRDALFAAFQTAFAAAVASGGTPAGPGLPDQTVTALRSLTQALQECDALLTERIEGMRDALVVEIQQLEMEGAAANAYRVENAASHLDLRA